MDNMKSMTENNIQNFILGIDFSADWSVEFIKESIKRMTGETPGIKVNYQKDVLINEIKGEATEYKKLNSIEIVFTDLNDQIKRVEYIVN
ncbi:MAG: hypothetical protein SLAVMIC_00182 [uncultured marine phage]|uniref:Uncharacterized protein n=1 Tax=uncultured marine phage TaxID=707152 RepID=A0A8D9CBT4_9VIRU|nr:MAG: hypothetical protein SLAVMIC_00182 [uncultured marine phage]